MLSMKIKNRAGHKLKKVTWWNLFLDPSVPIKVLQRKDLGKPILFEHRPVEYNFSETNEINFVG